MDLIRVSTALGRVAAICNHHNPRIPSSLLNQFPVAPSETLAQIVDYYDAVPLDDDLEDRRQAILAEIGVESGAKVFPEIPGSLDQKAFGDGWHSERKILREK